VVLATVIVIGKRKDKNIGAESLILPLVILIGQIYVVWNYIDQFAGFIIIFLVPLYVIAYILMSIGIANVLYCYRSTITLKSGVIAISFLFLVLIWQSYSIGYKVKLYSFMPLCERAINEINNGSVDISFKYRGEIIEPNIESHEPLRVVFMFLPGVVDNWVGLVYDSSGEVMKINYGDNSYRGLFGGDMTGCKEVKKNWYLCSFT